MKTMHEEYGEPNDDCGKHLCCPECGHCHTCGDHVRDCSYNNVRKLLLLAEEKGLIKKLVIALEEFELNWKHQIENTSKNKKENKR